MTPQSREVRLIRVPGGINAESIVTALRGRGIPARAHGEAVGAIYGLTLDGLGEVTIFVPEESLEEAKSILAAGEHGDLLLREEQPVDEKDRRIEFGDLPAHLGRLTEAARSLLGRLPPDEWGKPYPGSSSWTRSELLGHLIDSAINNQQRFARALIEDELRFPSYTQNDMVRVQRYREAPIELLIDLWAAVNCYLAYLLRQVPKAKLATICVIGSNPPLTLNELALDYLAHLEHHLKQLAGERALEHSDLTWPPAGRWQTESKAKDSQ